MKKSLSLALILSLFIWSCTSKEKQPNILILLADDAGYADFGFMGSEDLKTPNIDKIAAEGVTFSDFHVSGSVCSPSRAGLLTGRYQQRFGHEQNLGSILGMDTTETTLADILRDNGYATACIGKWHLGDDAEYHPNQRGFDEFYGMISGHRSYFPDKPGSKRNAKSVQHNGTYVDFEGYYTDVLGHKAIEFIKKNQDQPWFTYLSYTAVHTPMEATKEDLALFEGHSRQTLAAMTWALDRSVGEVIKALEETGQLDNTIIYFFSDNGGPSLSNQSSNYPLKGVKGMEFEGGHRVACAMKWKGHFPEGKKYDELTSSLDVFTTSIKAAGIETTTGKPLDGVDLKPYVNNKITGAPHASLFWRISPWAAGRVGEFKIVRADSLGAVVYNLSESIGEDVNLAEKNPALLDKMSKALVEWEKETIPQRWPGYESWMETKYFMYNDLMNNREMRFTSPWGIKSYRKKHGEPKLY